MKGSYVLVFLSACFLGWGCGSVDPDATISLRGARNSIASISPSSNSPVASMGGDRRGGFQVGDYVEIAIADTPLFTTYPTSRARSSGLLDAGTMLMVIALDDRYMHVQTEDGREGYVANTNVVSQGLLHTSLILTADELDVGGDIASE